MGVVFRVDCQKCEKNMRFDMQRFVKWDVMEWTCWDCGYQITTTNLHDTIIRVGGEEE